MTLSLRRRRSAARLGLSHDGRFLFVTNIGPGGGGMDHTPQSVTRCLRTTGGIHDTGTVGVIDLESGAVSRVIPVGTHCTGGGARAHR